MPILLITLLYLAYPASDNSPYNNQVRKLAHDLLPQCIADKRARRLPIKICYKLHDKFIKNNLRQIFIVYIATMINAASVPINYFTSSLHYITPYVIIYLTPTKAVEPDYDIDCDRLFTYDDIPF